MPVFTVKRAAQRTRHAAHPDHVGVVPDDAYEPEVVQEVGSAVRDDDGTIHIQLDSLPLSGRLLIRPPGEN